MFRSLAVKWTTTLLLTSLIGVVLVGIFAYRTTITEYDRLKSDQARDLFIENVTSYYIENGSWNGLESWLRYEPDTDLPPGTYRPKQQLALADANGVIVAGHGPFHLGDVVPTSLLREGTPVMLDDKQIGTAFLDQPPTLDPREQRYIDGTNRALLIGALGASAMALVIGLLLSRQFLRPLSELTQAITAMHTGNLDQRVEIRTKDELGLLARTFNEMSANLSKANQLRKQMTADIAHDLRTPLTVISGYLEALHDGTLKPTPARFAAMREEVSLLHRLIEDLRTLSLADAGELKLMRAEVDVRELLERVQVSFQSAATNVELKVDVKEDLPLIWIDSERVVQVLGNLVTNAIRHTTSGGIITLKAQQPNQIQVQDTGVGISAEDLPKIFDRLYRTDPSRHSMSGESGLGLAIAKSIIEAHGGTITAESEVGKGTTMTITVPGR